MSNDFLNVYLESDFRYEAGKYQNSSNDTELQQYLENELLQYQLYFEQGKWLDSEIKHIANELEKTGKLFAKNQGFGEGLKVGTRSSGRLRIMGTGNLVNGIHARPETTKDNWQTIVFYNDAKNERNEYYAGHMEYGFHDRGGNFIPARPFMRPALYAVAEGSKGNFANIMQGLLQNLWTGKGFQGVSQLSFGTRAMSPQSNFWSASKNFTGQLSQWSTIGSLKGERHRKGLSAVRPGNRYGTTRKTGYKFASNKRDFRKLRSQSGKRMHRKDRAKTVQKSKNKGKSNKKTKPIKQKKSTYKGVTKTKDSKQNHSYGRQRDYKNYMDFLQQNFGGKNTPRAFKAWKEMG